MSTATLEAGNRVNGLGPPPRQAGTRFPEIWQALAAPFPRGDIKSRAGGGGRQLSYITARTAMNRLDEVLGPENWSDRYYEVCGVLFCEITVALPDGSEVRKSDAGGFKEMTEKLRNGETVKDEENTDKTGASDAFKRAASKFGVARYLYNDGVPDYRAFEPPPPPPQNGTGHGMGSYARPDEVTAFNAWLKKVCDAAEIAYADALTNEFNAIPNGAKKELMPTFRLARHLLKFAREKGVIQAPAEGETKSDQVNKLVAVWFGRDREGVLAETGSYVRAAIAEEVARLNGDPLDEDEPGASG
jgi:hypothetical protein